MIKKQSITRRVLATLLFLFVSISGVSRAEDIINHTLRLKSAMVHVNHQADFSIANRDLLVWTEARLRAVEEWYGRFPVNELYLMINIHSGSGIGQGLTLGGSSPSINISLGNTTSMGEMRDDWVLVHELVHLALPDLHERHRWLEEGVSTYVEPHLRLQANMIDKEALWKWFMRGLPEGLPGPRDKGLDYTPTWGRTYWGGALFCFLADMEIRRVTDNQRSLRNALLGVLSAGGNITQSWPIRRVLMQGDEAVGQAVLLPLYEDMRARPVKIDLATIWEQLGLELRQGELVYHDDAPLAWLRDAMTATIGENKQGKGSAPTPDRPSREISRANVMRR